MTVLIVKNITREGPGMLEHVLTSHSVPYKIVDLSMGDSFPSPEAYSAVVVLGGPDSANDETPKMKEELKRIRETLDAGIPYLGICLGMQTLTKAAGGKVLKCPVKEIGWRGPD
ncbi:type 1 glutamine amidotransferase, partial [Candidatus Woesearchaeota archaeon]